MFNKDEITLLLGALDKLQEQHDASAVSGEQKSLELCLRICSLKRKISSMEEAEEEYYPDIATTDAEVEANNGIYEWMMG